MSKGLPPISSTRGNREYWGRSLRPRRNTGPILPNCQRLGRLPEFHFVAPARAGGKTDDGDLSPAQAIDGDDECSARPPRRGKPSIRGAWFPWTSSGRRRTWHVARPYQAYVRFRRMTVLHAPRTPHFRGSSGDRLGRLPGSQAVGSPEGMQVRSLCHGLSPATEHNRSLESADSFWPPRARVGHAARLQQRAAPVAFWRAEGDQRPHEAASRRLTAQAVRHAGWLDGRHAPRPSDWRRVWGRASLSWVAANHVTQIGWQG